MKLTRRSILSAIGASPVLLPFVPLLGAAADDGADACRLVFMFSSNGTVHEHWTPTMQGGEMILGSILEPLEHHKERLLVVDGLRYAVAIEKGSRVGHYGGMNTVLTGSAPIPSNPADPDSLSLASGVSIDQHVAEAISNGLKFKSLELGVRVVAGGASTRTLSYAGASQPIPADNDPSNVFERVYADFDPSGAMPDPAIAQRLADRRSVLDAVNDDLGRLRTRLAAPERLKVDAHLDALRDLERTLEAGRGAAATEACAVPDVEPVLDYEANDNIPLVSRLQTDLLVMALACDLTRVGTIQQGGGGARHRFTWLGSEFDADPGTDGTTGIHALAHTENNPESREKLTRCHQWYAGELAYLLDRLEAIPEGDGTMLDNTLVVWVNELGRGGNHSLEDTPWLLAGNVGGHFNTGRVVNAPGEAHNHLLVSILHAMGLDDEMFGDDDFGHGELPGLQ